MRGFVCVLVCAAALVAHTQAQFGGGPPHGGHPHGGHPGGGQPGAPVLGHGHPDPNAPPVVPNEVNGPGRCMPLWTEYVGNCYLFDSAALLPRPLPTSPFVLNAEEGLSQDMANLKCASLHPNASLVTVNDNLESDFLYGWAVSSMVEPLPVWIGLHAHPVTPNSLVHKWRWYNGEPVTFTNWEVPPTVPDPTVMADFGAILFEVDIPIPAHPNQVEISAKWAPMEAASRESFALICEYPLNGSMVITAPTEPATTMSGTTEGATTPVATTPGFTTPAPVMLNNPANLRNVLNGGMFGGSGLHEVPRRRNGPANYRSGPYYAVQP